MKLTCPKCGWEMEEVGFKDKCGNYWSFWPDVEEWELSDCCTGEKGGEYFFCPNCQGKIEKIIVDGETKHISEVLSEPGD